VGIEVFGYDMAGLEVDVDDGPQSGPQVSRVEGLD
jgi:hypothetical protein